MPDTGLTLDGIINGNSSTKLFCLGGTIPDESLYVSSLMKPPSLLFGNNIQAYSLSHIESNGKYICVFLSHQSDYDV